MFMPEYAGHFQEVETSWQPHRGGFGSTTDGVFYEGRICATQQLVAIKMANLSFIQDREFAGIELSRCCVANHPDIATILDVEVFCRGNHHFVGFVFEHFETNVKMFLEEHAFELAGIRFVLRKVASALIFIHGMKIVHGNLKPANLLMRPEHFAAAEWSQWLGSAKHDGLPLFDGCMSQRGCIFKVVINDFTEFELATPQERAYVNLLGPPPAAGVNLGTCEYRSPDLFLGNDQFNQAVDMWSLGCVAAELSLRVPLLGAIPLKPEACLAQHFELLGPPSEQAKQFLMSLPMSSLYDRCICDLARTQPRRLRTLPLPMTLRDFADQTLQWNPRDRLTAASAFQHAFLTAPCASASVSTIVGKHGLGSISSCVLHTDVLKFLQECPSWPELRARCLRNAFDENSRCVCPEEAEKRKKLEVPGYVEKTPPKCVRLNKDDLTRLPCERVVAFVRALRRCARGWLQQLQDRLRAELSRRVRGVGDITNGKPFMDEEMSDNSFVYASVQVMKVGERIDGWHTDGGASLLHAGLTIFGSRDLSVKVESETGVEVPLRLPQLPGSFYVGNLCALEHNVIHSASAPGSLGPEENPEEQVEIAVMVRSDYFRKARARRINACPGPNKLFRVVNEVTARHLAEVPFPLPDLAAVVREFEPFPASSTMTSRNRIRPWNVRKETTHKQKR